jgi:predicted dehydrogenase
MHKTISMKFLICGVGSIGERHIKNLLYLGYDDIILYRKIKRPLRTINHELKVYEELEEALSQKPDVALICNPTYLHMETALHCAKSGCHIFIEKPISNNTNNKEKLEKLLDKNNKIGMVGYMMRYHPCILKIRELINENKIGKIVSFRSIWGEYLPDWHPWENYQETYAALTEMGGGPALTLSHELDISLWMFGEVKKVIGLSNFNSNLEINTEHSIDILIDFKSGVTANIHLDYVQSPPKRCTEIIGTNGRIEFDYYTNKLELYTRENPTAKEFIMDSFDRNDMFVDELNEFINAIKFKKPSPISLNDGFKSVNVAIKALNF